MTPNSVCVSSLLAFKVLPDLILLLLPVASEEAQDDLAEEEEYEDPELAQKSEDSDNEYESWSLLPKLVIIEASVADVVESCLGESHDRLNLKSSSW